MAITINLPKGASKAMPKAPVVIPTPVKQEVKKPVVTEPIPTIKEKELDNG